MDSLNILLPQKNYNRHYVRKLWFVFLLGLFFSASTPAISQTFYKDFLLTHPFQFVDALPVDLLQVKTVGVVISDNRATGESLANKIHPVFVKSGIDPVGYYHIDDLYPGSFAKSALMDDFEKREIKYVIFLCDVRDDIEIVIAPFGNAYDYVSYEPASFRITHKEVTPITRVIYSLASSLERKNFLIVEHPEFQELKGSFKGQRFEAYKPDLKSETLYIPFFEEIKRDSSQVYSSATLDAIRLHNNAVAQMNEELKSTFANYPFPYEFFHYEKDEQLLAKKDIRYVLESVHTINGNARSLLNFKEKNLAVTEYVTVTMNNGQGAIKRIATTAPIYKYYIRHLPSNSYYLGTKWDADEQWQNALSNHIGLLIAEINH